MLKVKTLQNHDGFHNQTKNIYEFCMHFSNSSKLIICPTFKDGSNFPAEASANNSGENHLAN